ncbi:MAG: hypothetical protein J5732_00300 [Bacteroidaceae bacterium]|nr:hypothetical protein [Bacteroidaceae bacterium]
MKKRIYLSLVALFMASSTIFAGGADIRIVPRLEGAYNSYSNYEHQFGLGMSSLYSFLDGEIGDHFSYSASFHFLSNHPQSLYKYESPCYNGTFVDWAYMSYNNSIIGFDLGKIIFNYGGFAYEENDVDVFSGMVPYLWNDFCTYQYGLTFRVTPSENHSIEAQFATSPYMQSFKDMQFAYSLTWRGEMGRFSTVWTANLLNGKEADEDTGDVVKFTNINFGLGNKFEISDRWDIGLDLYAQMYDGSFNSFRNSEFDLSGTFHATDNLDIKALAGLVFTNKAKLGLQIVYYPIEALRLHAVCSYCEDGYKFNPDKGFEASIGATYTLDFHLGK